MATIITKNSATAGKTPSNLTQGELAINVADGRLFYGSGSSSVVKRFDTIPTASYLNTLNQNLTFNGNLTLNGTASISYLNVQYETASVIYSSGSNQFGDAPNDVQSLYGSVVIPTGSLGVTGSTSIQGTFNQGLASLASGLFSHVQGLYNTASGSYSHAEGDNTKAIGIASHAEGGGTTAIGVSSHAEGFKAISSGSYSHAEGIDTRASGSYSHAEGDNTKAIGIASHAEGQNTIASGNYSHTEGDSTQATGKNSHAEGNGTQAIGISSHAEGNGTQASGSYSHAEGSGTQAIGGASHAEGVSTQAIGNYSHAEGGTTQAIGGASHAEGTGTQAIGDYSHAEGSGTQAGSSQGYLATIISSGVITLNSTYGDVSTEYANGNVLLFDDSLYDSNYGVTTFIVDSVSYNGGTLTTEITLTDLSVTTTTAIVGNITYGISNWVGGYPIGGYASHAEGNGTQAIGSYSHAEGNGTQAIGSYSHAEGEGTQAIGYASHAEGNNTKAIGISSHAEGDSTQAIGDYSHAEGSSTIASASYQHVQGQWNAISSIQSAFIVGNGTDKNNRSNLIYAVGNEVQISGSLTVSGSSTFTNIGPAIFSGSVSSLNGFTGSLQGTASYATTAQTLLGSVTSASFASTASFVNPLKQNISISGSTSNTGSFVVKNPSNGFETLNISNGTISSTLNTGTANAIYLSAGGGFFQGGQSGGGPYASMGDIDSVIDGTSVTVSPGNVNIYAGSSVGISTGNITIGGNTSFNNAVTVNNDLVVGLGGTFLVNSGGSTLRGGATITGSLVLTGSAVFRGTLSVGTSSLGPNENTITLGARDAVNEGGQIGFNAPGGTYTSASMIDLYQNRLRVLRGTNAGSDAEVAWWSMHNKQMALPAYNSPAAFPGTAVASLFVDSSGQILTKATDAASTTIYVAHGNGSTAANSLSYTCYLGGIPNNVVSMTNIYGSAANAFMPGYPMSAPGTASGLIINMRTTGSATSAYRYYISNFNTSTTGSTITMAAGHAAGVYSGSIGQVTFNEGNALFFMISSTFVAGAGASAQLTTATFKYTTN